MPLSNYDPPKPIRQQCRHILTSGHRCQSPCLKAAEANQHEPFCYFHHTTRHPITGLKARRARQSTFEMPLIEDRSAIQAAINEILSRIASNDLDSRRAGLLLYGLQIASLNQSAQEAADRPRNSSHTSRYASEDHTTTVLEITHDPTHGPLAPIADYAEPGDAPGRKSLGRRLSEALDQAQAEAAQRVAAIEAREKAAAEAKDAAEATTLDEPKAPEEHPESRTDHAETPPFNPEGKTTSTTPEPVEPEYQIVNAPDSTPGSNETESRPSKSPQPDQQAHSSTLSKLEATADPELPLHTTPGAAEPRPRKPAPRTHRYRWPSNPKAPGGARPSHKTQKPCTPPSRWPYHR